MTNKAPEPKTAEEAPPVPEDIYDDEGQRFTWNKDTHAFDPTGKYRHSDGKEYDEPEVPA